MKTVAITLERPLVRSLGATFVFALITAALAQIAFRLPFTPVPVTLQVLGVVLSGMILGSRLGALAQLQYVSAGLAGAPVFAHFTGGPAVLLDPSGGYIPGFILGAFVTGLLVERCRKQDMSRMIMAGAAGVASLYACGAAWLYIWLSATGQETPGLYVWLMGIAPFIGIDSLKVVFASMATTSTIRWKR